MKPLQCRILYCRRSIKSMQKMVICFVRKMLNYTISHRSRNLKRIYRFLLSERSSSIYPFKVRYSFVGSVGKWVGWTVLCMVLQKHRTQTKNIHTIHKHTHIQIRSFSLNSDTSLPAIYTWLDLYAK